MGRSLTGRGLTIVLAGLAGLGCPPKNPVTVCPVPPVPAQRAVR
jgi:hypothetical protein